MQKRTTAKDYLLFGLLSLIVILIFLAMHQRDREWSKLVDMEHALSEQSKDVSALRGLVSQMQRKLANADLSRASVTTAATSIKSTSDSQGAFKHAIEASKLEGYAQGGWKVGSFSNTLQTLTPLVSSDVYYSNVQNYVQ